MIVSTVLRNHKSLSAQAGGRSANMEKRGMEGFVACFQKLLRTSETVVLGQMACLHLALCPYQLKPCLLEGVYFSSRAVNLRSEYFCSRFICATDWQLICRDAELRLGRWELWKLCHLSLCLQKWQGTEQGQVTETFASLPATCVDGNMHSELTYMALHYQTFSEGSNNFFFFPETLPVSSQSESNNSIKKKKRPQIPRHQTGTKLF